MYSWNTVRKLKMDDDTHSPEDSCYQHVKSEDPGGKFHHGHVHANALHEIITSSGFSKTEMPEQLGAFFATTTSDDDDEAVMMVDNNNQTLVPPISVAVEEELSLDGGSMFKFSCQEKVSDTHATPWHLQSVMNKCARLCCSAAYSRS